MLGSEQTLQSVIDDFYDIVIDGDDINALPDDNYSRFLSKIRSGLKNNVLDCSRMHIGVHALNGVLRMMRFLPDLVKIDFTDNLIRDSGLKSVLNILLTNEHITNIDLGCNDLGEGCALALADIIKKTPITSLQLGSHKFVWQANKLSADGLFTLTDAIIKTNKITSLGLAGIIQPKAKKGHNKITSSELIARLIEECTKLSTLDISYDMLVDEDQNMLESKFKANKKLRHLTLIGNNFSRGTGVTKGITSIKSLRYLDISNCMLSEYSCNVIADALSNKWQLIHLNLSNNPIGPIGISNLFRSLKYNNTLVSLKISNVGFDVTTVKAIEMCLKNNNVLDFLDLSNNFAYDDLAVAIAETLEVNNTLRTLNLSSCKITDNGALELCYALCNNNALRSLSLADNFISTEGCFEMVEVLKPNETLKKLDVKSNRVDIFALEAVSIYCKRNQISQNDQTLIPLRREYVRLSIEKSKIPRVEQYLSKEEKRLDTIKEKIYEMDYERDVFTDKTTEELKELNSSIENYNVLIREQEQGIDDIIKEQNEMEEVHSKRFKELKDGIDVDVKQREITEKEAEKIENQTKSILENLENDENTLKSEIEVLKKLIEEVQAQTETKEKTLKYKVPAMPTDEVIRNMATGKQIVTLNKPQLPKIGRKRGTRSNSIQKSTNITPRKPKSIINYK